MRRKASPKFITIFLRGNQGLNTKFQESEEPLMTSYVCPGKADNSCFPGVEMVVPYITKRSLIDKRI